MRSRRGWKLAEKKIKTIIVPTEINPKLGSILFGVRVIHKDHNFPCTPNLWIVIFDIWHRLTNHRTHEQAKLMVDFWKFVELSREIAHKQAQPSQRIGLQSSEDWTQTQDLHHLNCCCNNLFSTKVQAKSSFEKLQRQRQHEHHRHGYRRYKRRLHTSNSYPRMDHCLLCFD